MRDDMDKVIVERQRYGSCLKAPNHTRLWQRVEFDERPMREPIHRTDKGLSEHLNPLKRFLAKNVGRPWDKVYAELAAHIDRGNTVQAHIWQHLRDFVEVHVVEVVRGEPYSIGYRGLGPSWRMLFVDSVSGILRLNRRWPRRFRSWRPNPPAFQRVAENVYVGEINGHWFEVRTASIDAAAPGAREALRGKTIDAKPDSFTRRSGQGLYGSRDLYAVAKRSLNGREIRDLGLVRRERELPDIVRK